MQRLREAQVKQISHTSSPCHVLCTTAQCHIPNTGHHIAHFLSSVSHTASNRANQHTMFSSCERKTCDHSYTEVEQFSCKHGNRCTLCIQGVFRTTHSSRRTCHLDVQNACTSSSQTLHIRASERKMCATSRTLREALEPKRIRPCLAFLHSK